MAEARVILVTMVKNESRIIQRMLGSVVDRVDGIVVVDTGSTDNTVELAKKFLEEHSKPGAVVQTSWVNFGVSRTESYTHAQKWLRTANPTWDPQNTWAFVMDGDMVLEGEFDRAKLVALSPNVDGIMLNQKQSSLIFRNIRLMRMSKDIQCVGATHEYWAVHNRVAWDMPYINDIGDGGSKADKFTRDAKLLEEELLAKPNDVRSLFYLGQTYKCLQQWQRAITELEKRVALGGWDEECYMALVYIGECYMALKKEAEACEAWLRAWQRCPGRSEAAMNLVEHYRKKPDMQFVAMMYLEKLLAIQGHPLPIAAPAKQDYSLFVNHRKTSHDMWQELAILGFYSEHKRDAFNAIDALVLKESLDWPFRNTLLGYQKWYDVPFPTVRLQRVRLPANLRPWRDEPDADIWEQHNPSIRFSQTPNRYQATLRCANYSTTDAKTWPQRGRAPNIITRTVLCELDQDFNIVADPAPVELQIPADAIKRPDTTVRGIEDVRLMANTSELRLTGNSPQISAEYDKPQVCFMTTDLSGATTLEVREAPIGPKGICQKNWLMFQYKDQSAYVFSINPFQVFDLSNNLLQSYDPKATLPITCDNLRGGAAPVPWSCPKHPEEAYIMATHFCHYHDGARRYWTRFITLDATLKPVRLSQAVRFTTNDIEYVSTISPSLTKGNYIVGMGVKECECWVAEVTTEALNTSLIYGLK
jgi:glycosyltransferase involved in cell wall biosynthesis